MKKVLPLFLLPLLCCIQANATHMKGGNITYTHKEGLTYSFVITGYADTDSPVLFGSQGHFDLGDGTVIPFSNEGGGGWIPRSRVDDRTWKYELTLEHTYQKEGTYLLYFTEMYRNEGTLNMDNPETTPFYTEAVIVVENAIKNNSLRFTVEPYHRVYTNQTYHYNPKAVDVDGDSLSYHLVPCKQALNTAVANFRYPQQVSASQEEDSETGEASYFTINPFTGDIVWDAPAIQGEYNFAFEVVEWRKIDNVYAEVGRVTRDMQIIVHVEEESSHNLNIPTLHFPVESQQVQLEEGSTWELSITATADNPEDTVVLHLLGDFIYKNPEISPSDSIAGKGSTTLFIRYTHGEGVNEQYQLIATSYIYYSNNYDRQASRNRSLYLLAPGPKGEPDDEPDDEPNPTGINVLKLQGKEIYPNPTFSNRFFIESKLLEGKAVNFSLFAIDGSVVHHEEVAAFTGKQMLTPKSKLDGLHLLVIRLENKVFTSRVLFMNDK